MFRLSVAMVLALPLWLSARAAHAEGDPGAAEAVFQEGKAAMARHDYDVACEKFHESNELDPAVGTVFNLADCEEKRGRLGTAWALFIQVQERLTPDDERKGQVEGRIKALEPRLSRLTVELDPGAPEGTRITRDGKAVGAGALGTAVVVDPGAHELVVEADGYEPKRIPVEIREGESTKVAVGPGAAVGGAHTPEEVVSPDDDDGGMSLHPIGLTLIGVGLAGVGVGIGLGVAAKGAYDDVEASCPNNVCDQTGFEARNDAITLSQISTGVFIGGAVFAAAGVVIEIVELTGGDAGSDTGWTRALRGRWEF